VYKRQVGRYCVYGALSVEACGRRAAVSWDWGVSSVIKRHDTLEGQVIDHLARGIEPLDVVEVDVVSHIGQHGVVVRAVIGDVVVQIHVADGKLVAVGLPRQAEIVDNVVLILVVLELVRVPQEAIAIQGSGIGDHRPGSCARHLDERGARHDLRIGQPQRISC